MKHTLKITLLLVLVFLLAQFIGLVVIDQYIDKQKTDETGITAYKELPFGMERPEVEPNTSFIMVVAGILLGTVILLLFIRFQIIHLWKYWFFAAVMMGLSIAFASFLPPWIAIVLGVGLAAWKVFRPNIIIYNLGGLFVYGGLAAIFVPVLNLFSATVMLILISVYDMYAVWKIKHMITLANSMSKEKVFSVLLIPYTLKGIIMRKKEGETRVVGKKEKNNAKEIHGKVQMAILGGGDIGFPLMFAGAAMKSVGLAWSLVIPLFTAIALFLLLLNGNPKKFYPAMPFLTIGCLVGYGVVWVIRFLLA